MLSNLLLLLQEPAVVGPLSSVVTYVVTRWLSSPDRKKDDATQMREELRAELRQVRTHVERLERDLDEWKQKYFKLYEEKIEMVREQSLLEVTNQRLLADNATLRVLCVDSGLVPPPPVE